MSVRSRGEVQQQLTELSKVLSIARSYGTPDRASTIGMNSLLRQEASLLAELKTAEMEEKRVSAEVSIDGDPVRDHTIAIHFLGQLLVKLQDLTNAVAQVQANTQTTRGNLPNDLISQNRLSFAGSFASSFGVMLRIPADDQPALFENATESPVDVVCSLLEGQSLPQQTVDFLSSPRVRAHYAALIDLIGKQGASITFRTRKKPLGAKLSAQQARDRAGWLDMLRTTSEVIEVEGALVGGSIETKRFELKVDGGEILRGPMDARAARQVREMNFGTAVIAQLQVAVSTHEEAEIEPRTTHRLLEIRRIEEPTIFSESG